MTAASSLTQKFLRFPEVCEQTGKSRASIYAALKKGDFPAPVRIGARAVAWPAESIQAWKDACVQASRA